MDDLDTRLLVDLLKDRIRPSKELGQHFLIDDSVISRSVSLASSKIPLGEDSHVIEIGPGPGSLTLALLRTGTAVSAFEIDEEAVAHLQRVFGDADGRLEVLRADALEVNWPEDATHVVANLPYQISSPAIERIQSHHSTHPLVSIVLLLQNEFAERMTIGRDNSALSPLALTLWLDFDVELDAKVSPHSFSPSPRVSSRLVSLKPVDRAQGVDRRMFRTITQHCFANRRRKIRTLLSRSPSRLSRIRGWHKKRWAEAVTSISNSAPEALPEGWMELRPENLQTSHWVAIVEAISSE
ncbi:MAG: ribosomal RNA small subunit methyltransferase A [Candidatus Poseidoniales archaeon]|nr:MAG: ribosomal RNA small subunit methyltransferase A [Candidatus Poseidoniales archaeon]